MAYKNKHSVKHSSKILKLGAILAILVIIVLGSFLVYRRRSHNASTPATSNPPGTEKIDLSPPTEQEKQSNEQHKDELIKQQQQEQNTQTGIKQVKPIITDAGYYDTQVEVRSFVPGIYEAGGTCTITMTKDSSSITRQVISSKGATTTDCPVVRIPRSDLPSTGTWTVTVSYNSATAKGSSDSKTVEVK
jgi:hypothetical protein